MRKSCNDSTCDQGGDNIVRHDAKAAMQSLEATNWPRFRDIEGPEQYKGEDVSWNGYWRESTGYPLACHFINHTLGRIGRPGGCRIKFRCPCANRQNQDARGKKNESAGIECDHPGNRQCNEARHCPRCRPHVSDAAYCRDQARAAYHGLGKRMLATACAASPSRRPVKPRPSVVVAFTLTRAT